MTDQPKPKPKFTIQETPEQRRKTIEHIAPDGVPDETDETAQVQLPAENSDPVNITVARNGPAIPRKLDQEEDSAREIQERGEDTGHRDILPR